MHWFYNLKLSSKLLIGFVLVALIAGTVGLVGTLKIKQLDDADTALFEEHAKPLGNLNQLVMHFQRMRVNVYQAVYANNNEDQKTAVTHIEERRKIITEQLALYEKSDVTEEGKKLTTAIKAALVGYDQMLKKIINFAVAGKQQEAIQVMQSEAVAINAQMNKIIEEMISMHIKEAKHKSDSNTVLANGAVRTMVILVVAAMLLAVGLGIFISRIIMGQLGGDPKEVGEVANLVAVGDLSREILLKPGDSSSVMAAMRKMVDTIKALAADAGMLSKAAVEGKLATRADVSKHQGDFQRIVVGVNETLDAVIGPLNVAAEYVDRISKGDIPPRITDEYKGDFNEIKNNLNQAIEAVNALVADAIMLSKAAVEGKLATRADASKHQGDFQKIVAGVNETLDSVIGPLNVAAEYVDRISKGDIPPKIKDSYNGDFNEIKNNLNSCIDAIENQADAARRIGLGDLSVKINVRSENDMLSKGLVDVISVLQGLQKELLRLTEASREGQLSERGKPGQFQGAYAEVIVGVNDMLDAILLPIGEGNRILAQVSNGKIDELIAHTYKGDHEKMKQAVNNAALVLQGLQKELQRLTEASREGLLSERGKPDQFQGAYAEVIVGVNTMLDAILLPIGEGNRVLRQIRGGDLREKVEIECSGDHQKMKEAINGVHGWLVGLVAYITSIANGDLTADVAKASDKDQIHEWLVLVKNNISALVADANMLCQAAVEGKLATRADARKHQGDFQKIIEGVNQTLDAVIGPLNVAAEYVDRISKGDIPPKIIDNYNGDFNEIKVNLNVLIDAMNTVTDAAAQIALGNLSVEVRERSPQDQLMQALTRMVITLRDLARTAEQIADGDLTVNVKPASESDAIGNAFATMVTNLREIVGNVGSSSDSIASATKQIATGNADLAQRTEEQAASLEETAASMEELTSTVKQNADNSQQANQLAIDASDVAVKGGAVITRVVTTMDSISDSSKKIADIIGVIDGIAFQTNILALNAAVEAARAGEQGRGFAVVAGEVRNLAQRSAAAAKEIKALISDSVDKVGSGSKLVGEAGQTMQEIVTSIKRVTDIMAEISAASVEQSSGIEQVNTTITTMDEITQQNSSVVQQAASAAEALQEQAQLLVEAVGRFKLDDTRKTGKRDVSREQKAAAPHAASRPLKQTIPLDKVRKANGYHKPEKANGYHKAEMQEAQPVMAKAVGHDAEWNEF